jgi:SAM-dependent methyltransferase
LFYPKDYGPYESTRVERAFGEMGRPLPTWKRRLLPVLYGFDNYSMRAPELPPGRLLEVGCASGSYLYSMASKGWKVTGVEFAEQAAQRSRALGFEVLCGQLEQVPLPDQHFDLVAAWMVLEHLHEPLTALEKLRRATRPGGWLAAGIPQAGSWELRAFRQYWYALQLPTHLFHYSPATLAELLRKAGWEPGQVFYQRNATNIVASIALWMQSRPGSARLGRTVMNLRGHTPRSELALRPLAWLLGCLKLSGRFTIWARNPGGDPL